MTQDELKQYLHYDTETGTFTWTTSTSYKIKVGDIAGSDNGRGYLKIRINGKPYFAHRLAWLYVYGNFPTGSIDHIDRNRANNRLSNLREATLFQNSQNTTMRKDNTSGVKGVHLHKGKWRAVIGVGGEKIELGLWVDIEDAIAAITEARLEMHGEFVSSG